MLDPEGRGPRSGKRPSRSINWLRCALVTSWGLRRAVHGSDSGRFGSARAPDCSADARSRARSLVEFRAVPLSPVSVFRRCIVLGWSVFLVGVGRRWRASSGTDPLARIALFLAAGDRWRVSRPVALGSPGSNNTLLMLAALGLSHVAQSRSRPQHAPAILASAYIWSGLSLKLNPRSLETVVPRLAGAANEQSPASWRTPVRLSRSRRRRGRRRSRRRRRDAVSVRSSDALGTDWRSIGPPASCFNPVIWRRNVATTLLRLSVGPLREHARETFMEQELSVPKVVPPIGAGAGAGFLRANWDSYLSFSLYSDWTPPPPFI